jgi:ribonuclease HI
MTEQKSWIIFTDGASSGNPGPGGWGAIAISPQQIVYELGGSETHTTNNRMELTAAIQALKQMKDIEAPIEIYTDSTYVIRGITQWIWGWKKKGWISAEGKPIANVELWQQLSSITAHRPIRWNHVRGHSGIAGNERADEIAVQFSKGYRPSLYQGRLEHYSVPILDAVLNPSIGSITQASQMSAQQKNRTSSKKPFSYLSCVNHQPQRHTSWSECERRIQGRSGAKFKKAMSQAEEVEILRSWGFTPSDLPEQN